MRQTYSNIPERQKHEVSLPYAGNKQSFHVLGWLRHTTMCLFQRLDILLENSLLMPRIPWKTTSIAYTEVYTST
jgi:hypothetical protein